MVLKTLMADPLMKIFVILFISVSFSQVQLEFNSHQTGERRSTEIANDNSSNHNILLWTYPNLTLGVIHI